MKKILALVVGLLVGGSLYADVVTTNDRVNSRLKVRVTADADSAVMGYLYPNQKLDLIGPVSYWYEVILPNGSSGYVSKAYSRVVSVTNSQTIRIGSWNIKKLGHGSIKDFDKVAEIINSNFDAIAIVEVMQKSGTHPGYDELMNALGSAWSGFVTHTPRPNTGVGHAEYYAVIWREDAVSACEGWDGLVYFDDNDGSGQMDSPDLFSREPAWTCLVASDNEFLLAAYHATWSGGNRSLIAAEVTHLNLVFSSMAESYPGESDLLIAGDFNLVPELLSVALGRDINTIGDGSTLNADGELTENAYDHVISDDAVNTNLGATILDIRGRALSNRVFFDTVSDHLPVYMELETQ